MIVDYFDHMILGLVRKKLAILKIRRVVAKRFQIIAYFG